MRSFNNIIWVILAVFGSYVELKLGFTAFNLSLFEVFLGSFFDNSVVISRPFEIHFYNLSQVIIGLFESHSLGHKGAFWDYFRTILGSFCILSEVILKLL